MHAVNHHLYLTRCFLRFSFPEYDDDEEDTEDDDGMMLEGLDENDDEQKNVSLGDDNYNSFFELRLPSPKRSDIALAPTLPHTLSRTHPLPPVEDETSPQSCSYVDSWFQKGKKKEVRDSDPKPGIEIATRSRARFVLDGSE